MSIASTPEEAIAALAASGDYRVLRRLDLPAGPRSTGGDAGTSVGVVVDVETTGLDPSRDRVVELSLRRFRYDGDGVITRLDRPYSWLEDPGGPLDPAISALTGLTNADLAGRSIDERRATALLRSAHVRIAHSAAFDRRFVERRLPEAAGLAWACSLREVDWRARGFDGNGRALGWLLAQAGVFNAAAHRASADVDAVLALLGHGALDGRTALAELIATASRPTWSVAAVGAAFDVKDALRARGYRWNPDDKVWWREIADSERAGEEAWLFEEVYATWRAPRADGPSVREVTWESRHG